jgi:hypothetical protein
LVLAIAAYFICYFLFQRFEGWTGIILRSTVFTLIFFTGIFALKLTPDAMQLVEVVKKRFGKKS